MSRSAGNFVSAVIRYKRLIYLVVVLLIAVGIYGLTQISKDEFPTFEIKEGLVVALYPGATAQEVEQQAIGPLEDFLFTYSEVSRETYSYSKDGVGYIYVMLDSPAEKKDEVWSKIRHGLNLQKQLLPPGVVAVAVMDDFSAVSSLLISLESDDKGYSEMEDYAEELCDALREIPELSAAKIYGTQQEEIAVHLDLSRLSAYGLSPSQLMLDYQSSGLNFGGGTFSSSRADLPIHVAGTVGGEQEVAEKIVYCSPSGDVIRLRDIARVERRYAEPSSLVKFNGHTTLIISVEMRPDNDIVAFGREVDEVLDSYRQTLPDSVKVTKISDQPKVVGTAVWSFLRDLLISMAVVILVMLMLFPMRSAMIASLGVPVCTAMAIALMYATGMNLNTVTLAALIVVLGMIVDDAIITMDGYMDHLSRGAGRLESASASTRELYMPMLLATTAISLMFFPMTGIITGYLGDFVRSFPMVVLFALGASLLYALAVVPSLEVRYISSARAQSDNFFTRTQNKFFALLQGGYEKLEKVCFSHPYITIAVGLGTMALGVLMFMQLNVQMMPMAERDCFAVEIYLDPGSPLKETEAVSDSLQNILLADDRVTSVTAFIGTGSPRFHATYAPKLPGKNFAQFIVNTVSEEATVEVLQEYSGIYEHWFPNAQVRFKQMDYQGVTAPVEITFQGGTVEQMRPYADSLKVFMAAQKDLVHWVHSDTDGYLPSIEVRLDPQEAARLGVNKTLLSLSVSGAFDGLSLGTVWEGADGIPVTLYNDETGEGMDYSAVWDLMVPTGVPGVSVPLRQVAEVSPAWQCEAIPHVGGHQSVSVYADMMMGVSQPEAMRVISAYVDDVLRPMLPEGMTIDYGGLSSTNEKVGPEILWSFIFAVVVLFGFLLLHFKKISIAVLTMAMSLLCLFGASFGLWIFSLDFSITAVLGIISLVGIIVRNGIIMFEYAEELRYVHGLSPKEAAMEAGKRRMRPIFLTSCTTALGVLPMILSRDALWMPLGVSICFGTLLSIVLIVIMMPISYWQVFKNSKVQSSNELE